MPTFTILHLADFHADPAHEQEQRLRAQALLKDIASLEVDVDAIVFTGDIASHGLKEEYEYFDTILLTPLLSQLGLDRSLFLMIPGNHDVDRNQIDQYAELGITNTLTSDTSADGALGSPHSLQRLSNFYEYRNSKSNKPYFVETITSKSIDVGFACMNSAWRSGSDADKGKLFITSRQVNDCASEVSNCVVRIALIHHPLDWLHESEQQLTIPDLENNFDIILTGHVHKNLSTLEEGTSSKRLILGAEALSAGDYPSGYNIYDIDVATKSVNVRYRSFIRNRCEFDANVWHSQHGVKRFDLPSKDLVVFRQTILAQRLSQVASKYNDIIRTRLAQFQQVEDPIYVTPTVYRLNRLETGSQRTLVPNLLDDVDNVGFLFGPRDCGKSLLLHTIAVETNGDAKRDMAAVCLDLMTLAPGTVISRVEAEIDAALHDIHDAAIPNRFVILIDNVRNSHETEIADLLAEAEERHNWKVILALSDEVHWYGHMAKHEGKERMRFYRLDYWGPKHIRELARHFYDRAAFNEADLEAAAKFVINSLSDTDIPSTPIIVSLYLSIFPHLSGQLSSLSFLRMLEKYEEIRFGQRETSVAHSLYNKQRFLCELAMAMHLSGTNEIASSELHIMANQYFSTKYLDHDTVSFVRSLCEAGILVENEEVYSFQCYVFYDYYLARAFYSSGDIFSSMPNLNGTIHLADALSFYGGLVRENDQIADTVIKQIESEFPTLDELDLPFMDGMIAGTLLPSDALSEVDSRPEQDVERRVDRTDEEEAFSQRKESYARTRGGADSLPAVVKLLCGLQSFYRLFRNLENIDGEKKLELLNRILDYHAHCALSLITFFSDQIETKNTKAKSHWAYFVVMSLTDFLYSNIANENLRRTILVGISQSTNDYKKVLMVSLLIDLGVPEAPVEARKLAKTLKSPVGIELLYYKLRERLVLWEEERLPADLCDALREVITARLRIITKRRGGPALYASIDEAMQNVRNDWLLNRAKGVVTHE